MECSPPMSPPPLFCEPEGYRAQGERGAAASEEIWQCHPRGSSRWSRCIYPSHAKVKHIPRTAHYYRLGKQCTTNGISNPLASWATYCARLYLSGIAAEASHNRFDLRCFLCCRCLFLHSHIVLHVIQVRNVAIKIILRYAKRAFRYIHNKDTAHLSACLFGVFTVHGDPNGDRDYPHYP
jgi:hypothetical protein